MAFQPLIFSTGFRSPSRLRRAWGLRLRLTPAAVASPPYATGRCHASDSFLHSYVSLGNFFL